MGLEPTTLGLRVPCSTDWANRALLRWGRSTLNLFNWPLLHDKIYTYYLFSFLYDHSAISEIFASSWYVSFNISCSFCKFHNHTFPAKHTPTIIWNRFWFHGYTRINALINYNWQPAKKKNRPWIKGGLLNQHTHQITHGALFIFWRAFSSTFNKNESAQIKSSSRFVVRVYCVCDACSF